MRSSVLLLTCVWLGQVCSAHAGQVIADSVAVPSRSTTTVTFPSAFNTIPVITTLIDNLGGHAADARVYDVTTTGFRITLAEAPRFDGPHLGMTVPYIAAEPGLSVLPDGTTFFAGFHNTTTFQGRSLTGTGWDTITLPAGMDTVRTVLADVQSDNSTPMNTATSAPRRAVDPWITTIVRNISDTGFDIALERSDVNTGTLLAEDLGYIVIGSSTTTGSFTDADGDTVRWETLSSDSIDGWSNGCDRVNFSQNMGTSPIVGFTKSSRNEADGGWLRSCSVGATSMTLTIDEDTRQDNERSHGNESVTGVVFDNAFVYTEVTTAELSVTKSVEEFVENAGAIPGRDMLYTIEVAHNSGSSVDDGSIFVVDTLPEELTFYFGDIDDDAGNGSNVVTFTGSSDLTLTEADNVAYSNSATAPVSFADCTYTPDAGYDPDVMHICINPQGVFDSGEDFSIQYRTRIR